MEKHSKKGEAKSLQQIIEQTEKDLRLLLGGDVQVYIRTRPFNRVVSPEQVIDQVCEALRVSREEMLSEKRDQPLADARTIAVHIMRAYLFLELREIGRIFKRNHSTVLTMIRKFENLKDTAKFTPVLRACLNNLELQ